MIKELLSDPASAALAKSLQGASRRQEALANNIANIETPGYVRQDVDFVGVLQAALDSGDPETGAVEALEFETAPDASSPMSPDGNNVNVEHEMSELAKNSLRFDSTATVLSLKARMLRSAISEGRR
jgi:flagellar basal-body rod protein FlgB